MSDSNVSLLIQSDTTDGSTVFEDGSQYEHIVTPVGHVQHETDQKKFGNTSIYFDGSGDYLSIADHATLDFGSDDFTIDLWVYVFGSGARRIVSKADTGVSNGYLFGINASNQLEFSQFGGGGSTITDTNTISGSVWTHVAVVKYSGTLKIYTGGVSDGSGSCGDIIGNALATQFGRLATQTGYDWNGYKDEIRISKGVAHWTANFTPPTSPYTPYVPINRSLNILRINHYNPFPILGGV